MVRETVARSAVTTVVRPWSEWGTANLARDCDPRHADRADARCWRTSVPFGPRTHVHGHGIDPETGELRPVIVRGKPAYIYPCREEREV